MIIFNKKVLPFSCPDGPNLRHHHFKDFLNEWLAAYFCALDPDPDPGKFENRARFRIQAKTLIYIYVYIIYFYVNM